MLRPSFLALLIVCSFPGSVGGRSELPADVPTVPLTQTIRIPVRMQDVQSASQSQKGGFAALTLSRDAADELPEGPTGFDVLDDERLLITDPLVHRVAEFDAQGKLRNSWEVGFATDSVTATPAGLFLLREANTGKLYTLDQKGQIHPAAESSLPPKMEARRLTNTSGVVTRQRPGGVRSIAVQLDRPGMVLLSIEGLDTDDEGYTYVSLETTAGGSGDTVAVNKTVRKYAASGELLCETTDLPLNYYVPPVDELRIHRGIVYQLLTTRSAVVINEWDMSRACSR